MQLTKDFIRKKYLNLRKGKSSFDLFYMSWRIQERFLNSESYSKASVIGLYYPILNEVQTWRIITRCQTDSKTAALPIVTGQTLTFHLYNTLKSLKIGPYKIKEPPPSNKALDDRLDVIIVPGIAFDSSGYRVGYGKGFYDMFFGTKMKSGSIIIGFAYEFQVIEGPIKFDKFDVKMSALFTENRVITF